MEYKSSAWLFRMRAGDSSGRIAATDTPPARRHIAWSARVEGARTVSTRGTPHHPPLVAAGHTTFGAVSVGKA